MIDLDKAGAWDAKEQLEIAELLRNPTKKMVKAGGDKLYDCLNFGDEYSARLLYKAMIDAATGGEG